MALLMGVGALAFLRTEQAQAGRERDARNVEAVAAPPENQREATVLRKWHGFSVSEIAEHLDTTADAVTGLMYRSLKAVLVVIARHLRRVAARYDYVPGD